MSLPTLSLEEIASGAALDLLDGALREPGAFRLAGVPMPPGLLEEMHDVTAAFFALPVTTKQSYRFPEDQYTGWCGGDFLSIYGSKDHKEMFHVGPRVAPTLAAHGLDGAVAHIEADIEARALATCALWPDVPARFIVVWHRYYSQMQQVAATLGRALARLLGVPEREWFAVMGGNWADLAANFYPPLRADEDHEDVVYNAPHRDLTVFTILHQDQNRTGGLSVIGSDGSVIDVEPVPGTFAVNAGELLTYLSGGRWIAAMHQVTVSEVTVSEVTVPEARISIPFFYRPSDERVVTSFVDSQAKPIAMRQWVLDRKRGVDATVS